MYRPNRLNAKQQASAATTRPDMCELTAFWDPIVGQLRSYSPGEPIFAAITREYPGPFASWDLVPTEEENVFKFKNVGLNAFVTVTGGGGEGDWVVAEGSEENATKFRVQNVDEQLVEIKLPNEDLVWTVMGSGPRADVRDIFAFTWKDTESGSDSSPLRRPAEG
ncbi:hypothetical protein EXIGLDRAFT_248954 [Exidia glandulosa HHB12029]|uniref:Uncharacterized protein n=1 Tax=Exidia glandulosa HHB12029 TaxID=1314781 RepID=A0A165MG49_EXIGL|nr:hypothetical protein EXIGLDRAFT_248954 [Exidia glandulosa HHB12029]